MKNSITVYYADVCGNPQNCQYPHKGTTTTPEELKRCMARDHVFIRFNGNYRNSKNFEEAVTAVFDCDNDFTEDAARWISPEDISKLFPGVSCAVSTSRHHMKQKGSKLPRPRFHVIFAIKPITDPAEYTALMKSVQQMYPFFDDNALDAARFFFGNPDTEVTFFEGSTTLTAFIEEEAAERAFAELGETIYEGSRNNTMSLFAGKLLKRLGDIDEARSKFLERAESCTPPLEDGELETIWQSARKFYKKVCSQPGYVAPEEYNAPSPIKWEIPIPFEKANLPSFPTESLPKVVRDYVTAVAESTQTPVDMSASAALAILALCEQGKFRIRGKADWTEPLNLFVVVVAEPSERKSAVISLMTRPVNAFEADYNRQNAAELETSKMNKRILERRQRALEDKAAKGKVEDGELEQLAQQLATYKERTPLRLYVDDVTTEKLTAVLAYGGGKAAIVSAEGGIFDMLSGIYSKNVNIDVMLKGHSGDSIRVDRIGRNSESIMNPALTVLLTVQPNVLSGMMQNGTFRGRGLTARFLYCMPKSIVGNRRYRTEPIIDIGTYNLVQLEMARRAERFAKPQTKTEYPFTGLITCAGCGKHCRRKVTKTGPVWICATYNTLGKKVCPSKAIPEPTLMALAAEIDDFSKITAITADKDNTLIFSLINGETIVKRWKDRSRSESWTPEMRVAVGKKTKERSKQNGNS